MTSNDKIKKLIENYVPYNEQEESDKAQMIKFIDSNEDILTRDNIFGHLTASAYVVNEDFDKTLLVKHNILGGYLFPGGHADGESDFLSVAIREVQEETGLDVKEYSKEIFSICSAPVKGHVKKGKYVSAHNHYDFLYLVIAKNDDMKNIRILEDENSDIKWVNLDDSYNEDVVDWARPINQKIVQKIRSLKK